MSDSMAEQELPEDYSKVLELLEGRTNGNFSGATGPEDEKPERFQVEILDPLDPNILPPLKIGLRTLEFTIDPASPDSVSRHDLTPPPNPGFLSRLFRGRQEPRTTADVAELALLHSLITTAQPTPDELRRREREAKEKAKQQAMVEQAEKAAKELAEIEDAKKGLVIIFDDSFDKQRYLMQEGFIPYAEEHSDVKYILSQQRKGIDTVAFYQAFRKIEPEESRYPVIFILDGNQFAEDETEKGVTVAKRVWEISHTENWPLPYFVGESGDHEPNEALEKTYGDHYLASINSTTFLKRQENVFDSINSVLK